MGLLKKFASAALGLAVSATVSSAQVNVTYTTSGMFTGICAGMTCTVGGMTLSYTPLVNNLIVLDANNGFSSFLSYGFFTVTGAATTQASFIGAGFNLSVNQTAPLAGGTQVVTSQFTGGIDATSSGLVWSPLPVAWTSPFGASTINYTVGTPTNLQAPSSNVGVTTIQGTMNTRVPSVPEPSSYALMAAGLAGMFAVSRRKKAV